MENLVSGNEIFQARTRSIGVIPADMGLAYGLSGANIRASGRSEEHTSELQSQ